MTPTREIWWNVGGGGWIYALFALALGFLAWGLARRVRLWRLGRPEARFDRLPERLAGLAREVLGHARLLRVRDAGAMHALIFYGFAALVVATALIALQEWTGVRFLQGDAYLAYSLLADLFGILGVAGLSLALWRRAVRRPAHLPTRPGDWLALGLLLALFLQGFLVEGARIAATELRQQPELARWSPGGLAVAWLLHGLGPDLLRALHRATWWLHAATAFGLIGWLAWGKLDHLVHGTLAVLTRSLEPSGRLAHPDLEAALDADPHALDAPGIGRLEDLGWRTLLSLDACTQCGRCEAVCPASLAGTPLSPRRLVADLREHLHRVGPALAAGADTASRLPLVAPAAEGASAVRDEELWACRTCGACQQACPVRVEHVPAIVGMRRNLVMAAARLPDELAGALRSHEDRGHPFAGLSPDRTAWMAGLDVRVLGPGERSEWLLWVGCAGALVERNVRVTRALARVLASAGVDFAVLGAAERCTGDPARRIGDELGFQTRAKENVAELSDLGVRRIVTACPHCFNTLANEYPDFGGRFEVMHHSQLVAGLLRDGRLRLRRGADPLTYHDPCYLARHNGVCDAPREVLAALAPAGRLVELPRRREAALCCGAGGGHAFRDEGAPRRPSRLRAEEIRATGARTAAVACPFCMQMLDDALGGLEPEPRVRAADLAELVAEALDA
jgi:Fe-S oxidoreductase/nitrate reductase gamma subunit